MATFNAVEAWSRNVLCVCVVLVVCVCGGGTCWKDTAAMYLRAKARGWPAADSEPKPSPPTP